MNKTRIPNRKGVRMKTTCISVRNMRVDLMETMRTYQQANSEDFPSVETILNEAVALGLEVIISKKFRTLYKYEE